MSKSTFGKFVKKKKPQNIVLRMTDISRLKSNPKKYIWILTTIRGKNPVIKKLFSSHVAKYRKYSQKNNIAVYNKRKNITWKVNNSLLNYLKKA